MDGSQKTAQVVRIFESYGWRDANGIAQRLKDSLIDAGYQVWIDREHLRADDKHFSLALEQAIANSEVIVALLSPHSVRGLASEDERSSICYNELRLADELTRPIIPVRVVKYVGPPPFLVIKYRQVDWLDWSTPEVYRKGLHEITTAIEHALDNDTLLDPDIAFQATNFTPQLRTAADSFTGRQWLFDTVAHWLDGAGQCFLIEGVTGSGKTALVAELVRRNPGGRILAYHFCTQSSLTLDAASFVRSVAGMLATSIDAYAQLLRSGKLAAWLTAADPDTMLTQGVLAPLRGIAMDETYYIVVDALDEAVGLGAAVTLPALLREALPEFPAWLKLLVTSRPHQRVQKMFRQAQTCVLDDDNAQHMSDLRGFITHRLAGPAAAYDTPREGLSDQIYRSAGGNFQYASSVIDAVAEGDLSRSALESLPDKLEDLYYLRAQRRFPNPPDYRLARRVLGLLLAAREPLTLATLNAVSGLDPDTELTPTLDAISCFAGPTALGWRIAHKSIADWLVCADAAEFRVDPARGRELLLQFCLNWRTHREGYALKNVIAHLLEHGNTADALAAVSDGLFGLRRAALGEPRLDGEDSRSLTAALIAAGDVKGIVALSMTDNVWQRDGVAAALQAAPPEALPLVDDTVGRLLSVSR